MSSVSRNIRAGALSWPWRTSSTSQAERDLAHARAALSAILVRCEGIARPNGTTKVIARLATAGINGGDISEAGAKPPRIK